MTFDEIKVRHEKDEESIAEFEGSVYQSRLRTQQHEDRAWLIAEVGRLRDLCEIWEKAAWYWRSRHPNINDMDDSLIKRLDSERDRIMHALKEGNEDDSQHG